MTGSEGQGLARERRRLVVGLAVLVQGCAGAHPRQASAEGRRRRSGGDGSVPGHERPARHRHRRSPGVSGRGHRPRRLASWPGSPGFGLVVATEPLLPAAAPLERDHRSESDAGPPPSTGRARLDAVYARSSTEAAPGPAAPLRRGARRRARPDTRARVQITTVGLSADDAWRLKTLLELIRDARRGRGPVPRLEVSVEPRIRASATASRPPVRLGASPSSHARDRAAARGRTTYREVYTSVLGRLPDQSATFLVARER